MGATEIESNTKSNTGLEINKSFNASEKTNLSSIECSESIACRNNWIPSSHSLSANKIFLISLSSLKLTGLRSPMSYAIRCARSKVKFLLSSTRSSERQYVATSEPCFTNNEKCDFETSAFIGRTPPLHHVWLTFSRKLSEVHFPVCLLFFE